MDDELVDAVLRSLDATARASGLYLPKLRPVVTELVTRAREFGYADEAIHAILVKE